MKCDLTKLNELCSKRIGVDLVPLDNGQVLVDKVLGSNVSEGETGNLIAVISTDSVDSYGDIVHQSKNERGKGWLLDRFNGAPVMLWSHGGWTMNLSHPDTRVSVQQNVKTPKGTFAEALVSDPVLFDEGDEEAVRLEGKIRRRVIYENSVGFSASVADYIRDEEEPSRILGVEFFEHELMEYSWANRGANPDTSAMFKSMMLRDPRLAGKIATPDNDAATIAKAELDDAVAQWSDRVKTIEGLIVDMSKQIEAMTDGNRARAEHAKTEAEDAVSNVLKKLQVHNSARTQ